MSSPTHQTTPISGRLDVDGAIGLFDQHSVEASRGGPPALVIEQIAGAGKIYERLRGAGLRIGFDLGQDGPEIRLRGADGETLRALTIEETAEIALGTARA